MLDRAGTYGTKNIVIGCVYRHAKGNRDLFHSILKEQFEQLNTKGHELLVLGNLNENLLKYKDDKQTSENLSIILD